MLGKLSLPELRLIYIYIYIYIWSGGRAAAFLRKNHFKPFRGRLKRVRSPASCPLRQSTAVATPRREERDPSSGYWTKKWVEPTPPPSRLAPGARLLILLHEKSRLRRAGQDRLAIGAFRYSDYRPSAVGEKAPQARSRSCSGGCFCGTRPPRRHLTLDQRGRKGVRLGPDEPVRFSGKGCGASASAGAGVALL